ncbi:MAG: xylellain [Firmicutes bacterium]|nr:xylellain [Bacillota bacterium]
MRKYLLKKDTPDLRDFIFCSGCYKKTEQLPTSVDLRKKCSPIVNQGELGSCTANAIASGLREYLLINKEIKWMQLSRLFLYYEERLMEGTVNEDSGAEIRDGMKVLNQTGVCPDADWPYEISTFTNPPTDKMVADAAPYKVAEYYRITSLAQLKAALAEGLPVVIGIEVYDSFESDDVASSGVVPMPDITKEQDLGGHAVLVVGYDDDKSQLIVRNSWGITWGDLGYFYLPYDYYDKYASDCWTSRG